MSRPHREIDPVLLRRAMVERHVVGRGIDDPRVIEAMGRIQRHLFVDEALAGRAYDNVPLPIGSKQTISRPHVVALMTSLLHVESHHRVLEIGTGSGYQAAVLGCLARHVDTVERIPALVRRARKALTRIHADNVVVHESDGTVGLPELAPFDRILVTAGAPSLPPSLFDQLVEGGRLVIPVAVEGGERIQVVERVAGLPVTRESEDCAFVPLIGEEGHAS